MYRKCSFTSVFFILTLLNVYGQNKTIDLRQITSENGLSDNQVTCVIRDPSGPMWIGTKDGLNRYDGREFYIFKNNPSDSTTICGNSINCLELDADSLLWIGTTGNGFCSYDFRTGKFKTYNTENTPLCSNSVNDIAFDRHKNILWIAQNHSGLQMFDLRKKAISTNPPVVSNNTYYDVEISDTIPYFAGIIESLKRIEKIGKFKTRTLPTDNARTINKIFAASDGKIWCGAWDNGLHEFDKSTKLITSYYFDGSNALKQSGDEIISIAEDVNGILWCGTKTSGVQFFDLNKKTFQKQINISQPVIARIQCIYRDNYNRMWLATETGLYVYDPLYNQFEKTLLPVPAGTVSCKVNDRLITNGGKEFIITNCGLFYKNLNDSAYTFKEIFYRGEKQELTSIFSDTHGKIFLGTNRTLLQFDTLSLETKPMPANAALLNEAPFYMGGSRVNTIVELTQNKKQYIVAEYYGIYITAFDTERKNIFFLLQHTTEQDMFLDNLCRRILIDSKNNFWFCGATTGINRVLLPDSFSFAAYPINDTLFHTVYVKNKNWSNAHSGNIKVNNAFDLIENADGTFWVTTQGKGLVKFFPDNDSLPFISFANNLKSLQGIAKEGEEDLWIISSTGLLNYNSNSGRYRLFDAKGGVNEILSGYFFKNNQQGKPEMLSAGFDGGFISFYPGKISKDTEKPNVTISKFWVMDATADSLLFSDVKLSYQHNFIKFYLSSNCFTNNEQVTYHYRLSGIDNDWRNNENNPLVTYTNLPPGNFLFEYKAINSDGIEGDVKNISIVITPPFYKTIYFYALMAAILFSGAFALYRYRIKQLLKLQEVRNKIARDLHDDIGSTLGSINLYSQIANAKLKHEKPGEIEDILHKIGYSSREIIDKTSDAVWTVRASNDTLRNLILRMESYAAAVLGVANIHFTLDYDENNADVKLEMSQRKNIFLIFKEAINNIIKYAHCTEVTITIKKFTGKIQMQINDNGKGFDDTEITAYNGNGIKNMKTRALELGGTFKINSQKDNGTFIEILI